MNYAEFSAYFEDEVLSEVVRLRGNNDRPARREAWNDLHDAMGNDGALESGWYDWPGIPDELEYKEVTLYAGR